MSVGLFIIIAVVVPWFCGFVVWFLFRNNPTKSGILSAVISLIILAAALQLHSQVYNGNASYAIQGFFTGSVLLSINPIGYVFILLTSMVWLAASLFSIPYMQNNHCQGRFYLFFMLTLGSTLGVFVSGDMIAFFTFFEIMSLASFMLVVHEQDKDALQAGKLYIFMSIFGSLMALMGLFMIYHRTATLRIGDLQGVLKEMGMTGYVIYFLITLGLGVKAGIVPFHIWLPRAHPAAPSPASAILSGILLKTGIYGIFVASYVLLGEDITAGKIMAALGAATMVMGAWSAVKSRNLKVMLAYSSMSQMGYVILSMGTAAALSQVGMMGYIGGIYQAINHGIYEAMLFLIAGYLFLTTGTIEFEGLGGSIRNSRTVGVMLIAGLAAISGLPGLNGYIGKTLIHDTLIESYHYTHQVFFWVLEKAFILGSSLTAAYCFRMLEALNGKQAHPKQGLHASYDKGHLIYISLALLMGGIIFTAFFPGSVIGMIKPGVGTLHGHLPNLFGVSALLSPLKVYLLGLGLYLLFRMGLSGDAALKSEGTDVFDAASGMVASITGKKLLDGETAKRQSSFIMRRLNSLRCILNRVYHICTGVLLGTVKTVGTIFAAIDRGFSFESNIYRPIINGVYGFLSKLFGYVDKGVDFFYTFFTSFLTGIYHREEEEEGERREVIVVKERAVLYKKYRTIISEIAHGHFIEAGTLVREYFREKEYSTFNLNVGVIIFAVMVVAFMIIFVMYVPILSNGSAVF